jgi:GT2 family glycosyltransferase
MQRATSERVNEDAEAVGGLPLVTIIITVCNRFQFLKQAVESALGQTHPRVQVVIVDARQRAVPMTSAEGVCSSGPAPTLAEFGGRIELYRQTNGGVASARNHGIARAEGDFLLFLDGDEFLEPTAVETLLGAIHPSGAAWAAGGCAHVNEAGQRLPREHRYRYGSGDIYRKLIYNNLIGASASAVLARKEVVRSVGCFDEGTLWSDDYDLWLRLARDFPICVVGKAVTNHRVYASQGDRARWVGIYESNLRLLEKNKRSARRGYEHDFDRGIARCHLSYGDDLYVSGFHALARQQWRRALRRDPELGVRTLARRLTKSYFPPALLGVARRLAKVWRGGRPRWRSRPEKVLLYQ